MAEFLVSPWQIVLGLLLATGLGGLVGYLARGWHDYWRWRRDRRAANFEAMKMRRDAKPYFFEPARRAISAPDDQVSGAPDRETVPAGDAQSLADAEPAPGRMPEATPDPPPATTPGPPPATTSAPPPATTSGPPSATTPGPPPVATPGRPPEAAPGRTPEVTPGHPPEAVPGRTPDAAPGHPPEAAPAAPTPRPPDLPDWMPSVSTPPNARSRVSESTVTVLLVDDRYDLLASHGAFLEQHGYRVLTAADGDYAVELARNHHPSVILLDHSLPKRSGIEVARDLKRDPSTADIPIVLMTAHSYGAVGSSAMAAGCTAFLAKPCDPSRVLKEVVRLAPAGGVGGEPGLP